jgi:hypothetical protein
VLKVLNISENQAAKPSQSQVYRPISLNLLRQKIVRKIRRLFCTSQMSLGLFTSMLSYCKITTPRMVCQQLLIPAIAFFLNFFFLPPGFTVLGLDYFFGDPIHLHTNEEGFDRNAWITKSKQQANEAFPKWVKEVREIYGRYHIITNTERFKSDFFYIGANAKYSAVG